MEPGKACRRHTRQFLQLITLLYVIGLLYALYYTWPHLLVKLRKRDDNIAGMYMSDAVMTTPSFVFDPSIFPANSSFREICKTRHYPHSLPEMEQRILVNADRNLGYCNVPKVGSSFWFAVFGILEGNIIYTKSPEVVLSKLVDDVQKEIGVKFYEELPPPTQKHFMDNGFSFLFVRNPYYRILSVYMDKFIRPNDYYWSVFGKVIISDVRSNPSQKSKLCGHDVTFEEFVGFITRYRDDHHWLPIYDLCHPCRYSYKFIGKVETFETDAKKVMEMAGFSQRIDYQPTADSQVKNYMEIKTSQFIQHYNKLKHCLDFADLLHRLWDCFKAKGFVRLDSLPPAMGMGHLENDTEVLKAAILHKAYLAYSDRSDGLSAHNRTEQFLVNAYSSVSSLLMYKLRQIYSSDFLLFGYDMEPTILYKNRKKPF